MVPNSVTSWHLIHWHSKFQLALIFDRRRVFPTVHGRYLVVISVPFGISCNAVTTIRRSGWIWNLALLTQLKGWKKSLYYFSVKWEVNWWKFWVEWKSNSNAWPVWVETARKFQDFSVAQILREINFWDSRSSKNAIFYKFGDSKLWYSGQFQASKSAKIHQN